VTRGYRYQVKRGINTWYVIDQSLAKIRMHNDVVDHFTSREAARVKCQELNAAEAAVRRAHAPELGGQHGK